MVKGEKDIFQINMLRILSYLLKFKPLSPPINLDAVVISLYGRLMITLEVKHSKKIMISHFKYGDVLQQCKIMDATVWWVRIDFQISA